jgi:hypothetical protein
VEDRRVKPGAKTPVETQEETEADEMTVAGFGTDLRTGVEKRAGDAIAYVRPPRRVRALGYVRQEFDEMGQAKTSLEGQRARIAACADARDWHLVHTYEDTGWSGQDLDRPGLVALFSSHDFEILVVDRTDRLTSKKKDLNFLLALLEKRGVTCVPATWSWEPLAQYMRWWYRLRANPVYAALDSPSGGPEPSTARSRPPVQASQSPN